MLKNLAVLSCASLVIALMSHPASAALQASATLTSHQLAPNSFEYTITLNNTGTTPIGTFWYSWIPGYDLLPSSPTQVKSPTGWTGLAEHAGFGVDSIQWVNTVTPLQPGQSLPGFTFDSPDSPAAISGTSFFAGLPVGESYVYIGAPELDPGFPFVTITAVPEPASMSLLAVPAILLLRRRRK